MYNKDFQRIGKMFRQELQRRPQLRLQLTATTSVLKLQLFQFSRLWSRSARCMRLEPPASDPRNGRCYLKSCLGKRRRSSPRKWSRWAIFRFSQKASFRLQTKFYFLFFPFKKRLLNHHPLALSPPFFLVEKKYISRLEHVGFPHVLGSPNLAGWWTSGLYTVGGWKIQPLPTQPGSSATGEPSLARGAHLGSGSNQGGWVQTFTWISTGGFGGELHLEFRWWVFFPGGAERRDGDLDDLSDLIFVWQKDPWGYIVWLQ